MILRDFIKIFKPEANQNIQIFVGGWRQTFHDFKNISPILLNKEIISIDLIIPIFIDVIIPRISITIDPYKTDITSKPITVRELIKIAGLEESEYKRVWLRTIDGFLSSLSDKLELMDTEIIKIASDGQSITLAINYNMLKEEYNNEEHK